MGRDYLTKSITSSAAWEDSLLSDSHCLSLSWPLDDVAACTNSGRLWQISLRIFLVCSVIAAPTVHAGRSSNCVLTVRCTPGESNRLRNICIVGRSCSTEYRGRRGTWKVSNKLYCVSASYTTGLPRDRLKPWGLTWLEASNMRLWRCLY